MEEIDQWLRASRRNTNQYNRIYIAISVNIYTISNNIGPIALGKRNYTEPIKFSVSGCSKVACQTTISLNVLFARYLLIYFLLLLLFSNHFTHISPRVFILMQATYAFPCELTWSLGPWHCSYLLLPLTIVVEIILWQRRQNYCE